MKKLERLKLHDVSELTKREMNTLTGGSGASGDDCTLNSANTACKDGSYCASKWYNSSRSCTFSSSQNATDYSAKCYCS